MRNCCDNWWNGLTETQKETQKEWIHYFFHDIEGADIAKRLGEAEVHEMHESRFERL